MPLINEPTMEGPLGISCRAEAGSSPTTFFNSNSIRLRRKRPDTCHNLWSRRVHNPEENTLGRGWKNPLQILQKINIEGKTSPQELVQFTVKNQERNENLLILFQNGGIYPLVTMWPKQVQLLLQSTHGFT